MERNDVVKAFADMHIDSPDELFDYVLKHDEACVNDVKYDLSRSNEVMEFMACFLSLSNYKLLRLYFEKDLSDGEKFRHWFLVFEVGERWYYFEPLLEILRGQYGFDSYNEIMFFVVNRLNQEFNEDNKRYILKEVSPLSCDYDEDVKNSLDGTDIFINNYLTPRKKKESIDFNINRTESYSSDGTMLFVLGFFMTIIICVFVAWLLLKTEGII